MESAVRKKMTECICEVFRGFAFMFVEFDESACEGLPDGPLVVAEIGFAGEDGFGGALQLCASLGYGRTLAAAVLGDNDPDMVPDDIALDALGELVNVLCGRFTVMLYGDGPIFNHSVPVTWETDAKGWQEMMSDADTIALTADGVPLLCRLTTL